MDNSLNTPTRPQITEYTDYRLYLSDFFAWKKFESPHFTHQYCANKLGTAKSYLSQVFKQKIHISIDRASDIAKLFDLSDFEKQFFIIMIIQGLVTDTDLQNHFRGVLGRIRINEEVHGLKSFREKVNSPVPYATWLPVTIVAMANLPEFQANAEWIQKHLSDSVPLSEITDALKKVIDTKMIEFDGQRYHEPESHYSPDPNEINSHRRFIPGAQKSIDILMGDLVPHKPALFFNGGLAISQNDFKEVAEAYYRFINELMEISKKSKDPQRVLFVSNNLFHVTKPQQP
ncbi:TIGR02147 family protein [Bdellovibrio sp. NC01]|uniref:TIGR02147 family protein n=1 Tax=Bdellovibrio sp. NC01 TaxID=2220073 RepID=UPI00115B3069|nr:TIGR02147 family protein [Bdellovibrio sp. NC01]QDK36395.1 hypothetical protein DOE51_01660 [Bdellovibrio sp. NC01]